MRVRLVVHTILRRIGSLRFPFCVVGNLAIGSERPIFIFLVGVDDSTLCLEIRFCGGHPVSREARLAIGSPDDWACRRRGSTPTSTTTSTAARPLTRCCCASVLCRRLTQQYLAENYNYRQPENDC